MRNRLKSIYNWFIDYINYNPVTNCKEFKDGNCVHVDGLLCNPKTCSDFVMVKERKRLL